MLDKKDILIDIEDKIKNIYYQYFYNNYDVFFKTSVLFTNTYKIIINNKELFVFLDYIIQHKDKLNIKISKREIAKYEISFDKLDEKYIKSFAIFVFMIERFERKEFFFNGIDENEININLNLITKLYDQRSYNLKKEEEFSKYNLIKINENRKLFWQEPRIIDKEYEITFDIKSIDKSLYLVVYELYKARSFDLSFYPSSLGIKNYINESFMIFDEKEYGKKYSYENLKKDSLKENIKFSDYEIGNKLFIKAFKNELTFEEIQEIPNAFDDFELMYTKVVHLIFFAENEILYIKHIDLEYIFYTLDEYIERFEHDNFEQKGTKYKRQKIFKIDNAKIDLINHLYDLVYYSLDNKNLVDEYFEMLNE